MSQIIPLELLQAGEEARVQEVEGQPEFTHRLAEMGIQAGTLVRMIRAGSPCLVAVNNHRMSLRIEGSALVLVETLDRVTP